MHLTNFNFTRKKFLQEKDSPKLNRFEFSKLNQLNSAICL